MTLPPASPVPLVLVDGSSYLYRAFHALPPLSTRDGRPTGAVLGVYNMLRKLIQELQPQRLAVVFDARGKTFRDELFQAYKAHRPAMPDDLARQVEPLKALIRAMGVPLLEVAGVEADDVIGTLARQASERQLETVISTGDKDMAQLVDAHVALVNTMTGNWLDRAGVVAKFGVPPEHIVDYLALVGDSSDNIPGVPQVGPKTAAKWLGAYGSLDALVAAADTITGKVGASLREHLEQLALSRELARIRTDVALDLSLDDLHPRPADTEALLTLAQELELGGLLRELKRDGNATAGEAASASGTIPGDEPRYHCIRETADLERWLARLEAAELIALDTETTSLNSLEARIVGISFAVDPGEAIYIPLAHEGLEAEPQLDREATLARLKPLLEDDTRPKLGQNLKYDRAVLENHGIRLRGVRHDTMLESYVLDSTARHDLDSMAQRELGVATMTYESVTGKGAKQIPFAAVPIETATRYAAEDADIALRLHRVMWPRLQAIPALNAIYTTLEMPLLPVLGRMERAGVRVDAALLRAQSAELSAEMARLREAAQIEAGSPFNLDSPKQLQEILFDKLGLPVVRKTPTGQPSTAEDVLQELAADYPLPRLILDYRSLAKLKSTYTDKLPTQIDPRTGRIHTSYQQAVAATGRLSSADPNLQNIPVRTAQGRRIRQAFIADPGHVLLSADYSQIELRIMAHLSGDARLCQAFAQGEDVHRATAAEIFGVPLDQVQGEQRRAAKAINFGLIYGMSAFGLARQLGIAREAAQRYVDLYFERYPGVRVFMDQTRARAREQGYVETVFGRRLYVPDIQSRNASLRQYAERTAINAPMQGTAADIIKRAMIAIDRWITEEAVPARMILQVHDELVFEIPVDAVESVREGVLARMQGAADLAVPLEVEAGVGANWDAAHGS
ncbi:MAG TPA: DNA polymerase I [Candidatus Acidoferrales bacterium]|nr:DNA polymerase I [Candidatus Acidoferrales bacterium]